MENAVFNPQAFRDQVAIEVMKTLLGKIPIPALPNGMSGQDRYNFIQSITRDSFELAEAMAQARMVRPY